MTPVFSGLLIGLLVGYFTRRARLCSFGAIESALVGQDWRRMKVFGLALGVALLLSQTLALTGLIDPAQSTYAHARVPWLATAVGAMLFGLGMALVGTCAFGSLIRLGSGDLRSLIVLIVFGAVAYAVLRGVLAPLRIDLFERVTVDMPASMQGTFASLMTALAGKTGAALLAGLCAMALVFTAVLDGRLWRAPKLMTAGLVLGLGVVAGWAATGLMDDEFAVQRRLQSLTFVAPVARGLYGMMLGTPGWLDFGVASVVGVTAGSGLAARMAGDFRWEAFDDPTEMRRHLLGAVLMGLGGVLAGGCTIGQGLSAASLTALTAPIAIAGMMLGARLGILLLVEGSLRDILAHYLGRR